MMRRRAQHVPSSPEENLPSSVSYEVPSIPPKAKVKQMSQNFRFHHSLVADGTISPCSKPSEVFANAAVGLLT